MLAKGGFGCPFGGWGSVLLGIITRRKGMQSTRCTWVIFPDGVGVYKNKRITAATAHDTAQNRFVAFAKDPAVLASSP